VPQAYSTASIRAARPSLIILLTRRLRAAQYAGCHLDPDTRRGKCKSCERPRNTAELRKHGLVRSFSLCHSVSSSRTHQLSRSLFAFNSVDEHLLASSDNSQRFIKSRNLGRCRRWPPEYSIIQDSSLIKVGRRKKQWDQRR